MDINTWTPKHLSILILFKSSAINCGSTTSNS